MSQSRVGPVEWLKPYTDTTIVELGKRGVKSLLAVPIRSVSRVPMSSSLPFFLSYPISSPKKYKTKSHFLAVIIAFDVAIGVAPVPKQWSVCLSGCLVSNCSFVSEHIETLEEIDMEYRELALESGIVNWGRVPALGCDPTFIADLADAVIEALPYVGAMAVSNLEARQVINQSSINQQKKKMTQQLREMWLLS